MQPTKVSVITVVYNGVAYIEKAIQSVLAQSYDNIEYIIIDNQSTDGTLEIVEKYKDKITVISESDNGIYHAMNKGIALVSGELIGILNSDDWYEPNAVKLIVDAYHENPSYDVFHGLLKCVDTGGNLTKVIGHHFGFLRKGMIEHPTCFLHRRVYDKLIFDTQYKAAGDYDFMLRVLEQGFTFFFLAQPIASFRSGGISTSFIAAKETLAVQRKHNLISIFKKIILTNYFKVKLRH